MWPLLLGEMAAVTSEQVVVSFETAWSHWANLPQRVRTDPGSEFRGVFEGMCRATGVLLDKSGTEAHWAQGQVEVRGKIWRASFEKSSGSLRPRIPNSPGGSRADNADASSSPRREPSRDHAGRHSSTLVRRHSIILGFDKGQQESRF